MVIIHSRAGQLANRLFHFSHFIGNSLEHDYKLIYPYFDDYKTFFEATEKNNFPSKKISIQFTGNHLLNTILRKVINRAQAKYDQNKDFFFNKIEFHSIKEYDQKDIEFDLNNEDFIKHAKKSILFTEGWLYRDRKNILKHQSAIKKIFTPKASYLQEVERIENLCSQKGTCIIGVHIRRGDYQTFNSGLWYYPDQLYAEKMRDLERQLAKKNIQCVFYICSNEELNLTHYSEFNIVVEPSHFIVDLYMLARCNYIIGAPSTYSAWASFHGNVPLFHIMTPESEININDFSIKII